MHRFSSLSIASLLVACCCATSPLFVSQAYGQDADDPEAFTPSDDELDRELDESLREEFESEPEPDYEVVPPYKAPPPKVDAERDDRLRLRLGGMAAYAWTAFHDLEISHAEGNRGGDTVVFDGYDEDDDANSFEFENGSGYYRAWFDIGRYVTLQASYSHAGFSDTAALSNNPGGTPGFVFGNTVFQTGDVAEVSYTRRVADFDIAVHPLNLDWIRLDVTFGARYVFFGTQVERHTRGYAKDEKNLEALIPMIGLGLSIRPVQPFEIFVRGRIGGIELEREEGTYRRRNGERRRVEPFRREQASVEVDAGFSLTLADTIGIIVGAKIDYLEIERENDDERTRFEGTASSLYAGVILNF